VPLALVDGVPLAGLSLTDGRVIADPLHRTAHPVDPSASTGSRAQPHGTDETTAPIAVAFPARRSTQRAQLARIHTAPGRASRAIGSAHILPRFELGFPTGAG
jgi:hypothetical protein